MSDTVTIDQPFEMSRRRFLVGLLALSATPLLAACGAAPVTTPTQTPAASNKAPEPAAQAKPAVAGQGATISMIGLAGHPSWEATKQMVKLYGDKAPQVQFKLSEFDLNSIGDKVNVDFQAKKGEYDIVWMNSAFTIGYWTQAPQMVMPLDDYISKDYALDDFLKLARNIGTMNGKFYGIPIMIEDRMLVYRKDLFEEAGLKVPTTVEEMTAAAQKLTKKDKNLYGYSQRNRAGGAAGFDFPGWLYAFGAKIIDEKFQPQLATPEAKSALEAYIGIEKFCTQADRSYGEVAKELQTGVAAMAGDSTVITPLLEDAKATQFAGKFGYGMAPAGPKGPRPETSAHLLAISSLSKQREPAWEFIQWMTSKENSKAWVLAGGSPFRESMFQDKDILAKFPMYELVKQILDRGNPDYIPRVKPSFEIATKLGDQVNAAVVGVKTIDQALADAQQAVTAIMKRDGYI